ncbi:MAG: exo-alpha-sialidase [Saprospiraceae bacterium]|nr:exo-alpha-sialidase [Saprospiraceae bacterium]
MKKGARNYIIFAIAALHILFVGFSQSQSDRSFLNPPQIIDAHTADELYLKSNRKFSGIPSMAIAKNGRIWAVWYAGITPAEDHNNYVVVATSIDGGETWEEMFFIDPDREGPVRSFDPQVWIDPGGKLWVFWAQTIGLDGSISGIWCMQATDGEDEDTKWSKPRRLHDGIMMNKPTVLDDGTWLIPAATWMLTNNSAKVLASSDQGKTWMLRGAVNVPREARSPDEPMIVERRDGSLWILVRTRYGIGESTSADKGVTWSPLIPSSIGHATARFFIRRLSSGNLLLVKHGPISQRTDRSHLMAFISKDDGRSWSKGLMLDQRLGVSYPDGQQTQDGTIWIVYDFDRRGEQQILMTTFSEEDVLAKNYDEQIWNASQRRKTVSKHH